ncbi:hypothetical protein [Cognatilysobacter lacus]|uniref:C-type lysozyme inhibitor domain-containing protein n=1 Tax=Cognatilysobacter lacus TaxID=1643323 RepID=A0A5D8ZAU0_9GAMM|nr:hypothetical protein [Lysobacter lacus]TZF91750.1 hypothetical protein FW784_00425 [Lysobacter lacus]
MPTVLRSSAIVLILLALAACSQDKRSGEPRMRADEPEAAGRPTGVSAEEGHLARGTTATIVDLPAPDTVAPAAFTCAGGNKVDITPHGAVVTLEDGRSVRIDRDAADALHFHGEALEFRMKNGQGDLSQDEGGTFHCTGS